MSTTQSGPQEGVPREPPEALRRRLDLSDEQLRAECVFQTRRVRGPGGQHRNKTESAVRLLHGPSGLVATGQERRSQHENAANALWRLRELIAVTFHCPLPAAPAWPDSVRISGGHLRVAPTNAGYFHVVAMALDALAAFEARPQDAAAWLGVSSSSLTKFLAGSPRAWQETNRLRAAHGKSPLRD